MAMKERKIIRLQPHPEGVVIPLRVAPGSSRSRIVGEYAGMLKVAVRGAPEKGKANKEVIALTAGALKVPEKSLSIIGGETSREKKLLVRGVTVDEIRAGLRAVI